MRFQEIFHVLSDDSRQFFDLEGDHIQKTHAHTFLDSKLCEGEADDEPTNSVLQNGGGGRRAT
jgi:hypothetical protein